MLFKEEDENDRNQKTKESSQEQATGFTYAGGFLFPRISVPQIEIIGVVYEAQQQGDGRTDSIYPEGISCKRLIILLGKFCGHADIGKEYTCEKDERMLQGCFFLGSRFNCGI